MKKIVFPALCVTVAVSSMYINTSCAVHKSAKTTQEALVKTIPPLLDDRLITTFDPQKNIAGSLIVTLPEKITVTYVNNCFAKHAILPAEWTPL